MILMNFIIQIYAIINNKLHYSLLNNKVYSIILFYLFILNEQ